MNIYIHIYCESISCNSVGRKLHVLWGWVGLNLTTTSALFHPTSTMSYQWRLCTLSSNCFVKSSLLKGKCHHVKTSLYVILKLYPPALCVNKWGWIFQVSPEGGQVPTRTSLCKWFGINVTKLVDIQYLCLQPRLRLHNLPHHMQIGRRMWGRHARIEHNNNLDTYIWVVCGSVWI